MIIFGDAIYNLYICIGNNNLQYQENLAIML